MVPHLDKFHVYAIYVPHAMSIHKAYVGSQPQMLPTLDFAEMLCSALAYLFSSGNIEPCLELAATSEQVCQKLATNMGTANTPQAVGDVRRPSGLFRLEANIIDYGVGVLLDRGGMGSRQRAHDKTYQIIELREKYIADTPQGELDDNNYVLLANAYSDWALQLANEGLYQESREYSERSPSMKERYLADQENGYEFFTSGSLVATAHLAVGSGATGARASQGIVRGNRAGEGRPRRRIYPPPVFCAGQILCRGRLDNSLFGEYNSDTLNSCYAVALCLYRLGRHEEARGFVTRYLANKETARWCVESIIRAEYLQSLIMHEIEGGDAWRTKEASAIQERNRLLRDFGRGAWANPDHVEDGFVYFDFINNISAGRFTVKTL